MRSFAACVLALLICEMAHAGPLLLQTPTVSRTQIAFVHADDLWIASRDGGDARVLVRTDTGNTGPRMWPRASVPRFSPDGRYIAYSAVHDGNLDVYVVASEGGEPRRLTSHPGDDFVVGWTPDGERVLFVSRRDSANRTGRLYTVAVSGGPQLPLPLSRAEGGDYSPDAGSIAYEPQYQSQPDWNGYRGGQTTPIWIARLPDSSITRISHEITVPGSLLHLRGLVLLHPSEVRGDLAMNASQRSIADLGLFEGKSTLGQSGRYGTHTLQCFRHLARDSICKS
ncbi:hypothetical protein [[Pseudomonas] boreopolis]|uniref:hypothetical protein n=1 Tax=Xanthomonas boreopolis TaxID=86183 RepID=UPI003D9FE027